LGFVKSFLIHKGFTAKFVECVMRYVTHGKVAVMVNDIIGKYFESSKGLRQGDSLSPILFNTEVDVHHVLVRNVVDNGLTEGLVDL
jgi:hypothetical protein